MKSTLIAIFLWTAAFAQAPKSVTVPITLDHNRAIVDVYLPSKEGSSVRARALFDLGGLQLELTEALARKLGLPITGQPEPPANPRWYVVPTPSEMRIGTMRLPLNGFQDARALLGVESVEPGCNAEITLPSGFLKNYDVVVDYPNRQLTVAPAGTLKFEGTALDSSHGVPVTVGGRHYTFGLNLGQGETFVSNDLFSSWTKANPDWPRMNAAVGPANSGLDLKDEQVLLIPSVTLGPVTFNGLIVTTYRSEMYETGVLGANAFSDYRVGFDFAHGRMYLKQLGTHPITGIDAVGIVLRAEKDGRFTIVDVAEQDGKPAVPDVKAGDLLVGVDGAPATGATLGQVWSLLGGTPGQTRTLTLEREGKKFTVDATVRRFLAVKAAVPVKSPRRNPHRRN